MQIPVQTNVNNTTTVIYVDATLKLDGDAADHDRGHVLLDVDVSKREPAVALNLVLGQNVPLTSASTGARCWCATAARRSSEASSR